MSLYLKMVMMYSLTFGIALTAIIGLVTLYMGAAIVYMVVFHLIPGLFLLAAEGVRDLIHKVIAFWGKRD